MEDFERFLNRAGNEITAISETTLNSIRKRFENENKKTRMPDWQVIEEVKVDEKGKCDVLKGRIIKRFMTDGKWEELIGYMERYIKEELKDNPRQFKEFIEWYDTYGPFDIIIDGGNISK